MKTKNQTLYHSISGAVCAGAVLLLGAFCASAGGSADVSLTTLHSFSGYPDGDLPSAPLAQGSDGYFYGTTAFGGTSGNGTVFKISSNGAFFTTLWSFTGFNDGLYPFAGLVEGSDGYFYGTASDQGVGNGTVFRISSDGVLTNIYSLSGCIDGQNPVTGLIKGGDGFFYGTAQSGGKNYGGTVFAVSSFGAVIVLHSFDGTNDGGGPQAPLVVGRDGYFYGTTYNASFVGYGAIFKVNGQGAFTNLHSFTFDEGERSAGGLVEGRDGCFYGTTVGSMYYESPTNWGTVFKISSDGTFTTLYSFGGGNDGAHPYAGLVQGCDGYFYGTTSGGGTNGQGTIFKISSDGIFTSLYSFNGSDGSSPAAPLVQDNDGYFYGTTTGGGDSGGGTVFKLAVPQEVKHHRRDFDHSHHFGDEDRGDYLPTDRNQDAANDLK